MPDRFDSMQIFVDVTDLGSFAAAATKHGISPQMVAKHVAALETRLGIRLLHRTTRRQGLTEQGRLYRDRCRAILADLEDAEMEAADARTALRGTLRINAPVMFGTYVLTPLVTRFLRAHPDLRCELGLSDSFVDPVEDGYDAVFRIGPIDERGSILATPLPPYRLIVCASPAYVSGNGRPVKPGDLVAHECLGFTYPDAARRGEWRLTEGGRTTRVAIDGRLSVDDWEAMHRAALDGFGVMIALEAAVADDLQIGRLVRLLPEHHAAIRPMHLLQAREGMKPRRVDAFVDAVLAMLAERPASER